MAAKKKAVKKKATKRKLSQWKLKNFKGILKSWSYSRWSGYKTCPFKIKCTAIDKLKEPENYYMARGKEIHAKGEQLLKGNIRGMPPELQKFSTEFKAIKKLKASPEVDLSATREWEPSRFDDWNNVWVRAFADALVIEDDVAGCIDYKTGRYYEGHDDQGHLYSTLTFLHNPQVEHVDVEFWYLDKGFTKSWEYDRDDLPIMVEKWEDSIAPMMNDKTFKPKPNNFCKKCHFRNSNGGHCKYG
jgi:CRISPR/Cas system-associated exonuclease Cas4 (RecB family)